MAVSASCLLAAFILGLFAALALAGQIDRLEHDHATEPNDLHRDCPVVAYWNKKEEAVVARPEAFYLQEQRSETPLDATVTSKHEKDSSNSILDILRLLVLGLPPAMLDVAEKILSEVVGSQSCSHAETNDTTRSPFELCALLIHDVLEFVASLCCNVTGGLICSESTCALLLALVIFATMSSATTRNQLPGHIDDNPDA